MGANQRSWQGLDLLLVSTTYIMKSIILLTDFAEYTRIYFSNYISLILTAKAYTINVPSSTKYMFSIKPSQLGFFSGL